MISRSTALAFSCTVLACAGGQPTSESPQSENSPRDHVVVRISDMHLYPATARLTAQGNMTWVNVTSNLGAVVTFPDSIMSGFTCSDLRPLFSRTAEGYESIVITQASTEDVYLPCRLRPGTYDYEIDLFDRLGNVDNPQLTLPGRIVVDAE